MPLRSTKTICFITLALIAWGLVSTVIQLSYAPVYLMGKASLSLPVIRKAIDESLYWLVLVLFLLVTAVTAAYLRKKAASLEDCWGKTGLMESLPEEGGSITWLAAALAVFAGAMAMLHSRAEAYSPLSEELNGVRKIDICLESCAKLRAPRAS